MPLNHWMLIASKTMSFFPKPLLKYTVPGQAHETLTGTLKQLCETLATLLTTPAYMGAFDIKDPHLLHNAIQTLIELEAAVHKAHLPGHPTVVPRI